MFSESLLEYSVFFPLDEVENKAKRFKGIEKSWHKRKRYIFFDHKLYTPVKRTKRRHGYSNNLLFWRKGNHNFPQLAGEKKIRKFMRKHLSSPQNPLVKNIGSLLTKSRQRRKQNLFVAEGLREVGLALVNGFEATHLLFEPEKTPEDVVEKILAKAKTPPAEVLTVSPDVFKKIAYRDTVTNVVAIFKTPPSNSQTLNFSISQTLKFSSTPLLLILEGMQKPGNFGAMLRTADAAGVDAVVLCEPDFDLFNPNAIRASLGAIFTLPILVQSSEKAVAWLRERRVKIFATWLEAAKPLYECDLSGPTALVLGAEATGITPFWVEQADERIIIPMTGQVDSLNVSNSAAIVMYEAVRQRGQKRAGGII